MTKFASASALGWVYSGPAARTCHMWAGPSCQYPAPAQHWMTKASQMAGRSLRDVTGHHRSSATAGIACEAPTANKKIYIFIKPESEKLSCVGKLKLAVVLIEGDLLRQRHANIKDKLLLKARSFGVAMTPLSREW